MKHFRVWKQLAALAFSSVLSNRLDSLGYLLGKVVRFGFFFLFLLSLFRFTDLVVGYTRDEVFLFFLIFNVVDIMSQALFRGIYLFRQDIRKGAFDALLTKPVDPLFYSMSRLTDMLDLIFLIPILGVLVWNVTRLPAISLTNIVVSGLLCLLSFVIVASFHILSAALTIWTEESENIIWLYRDATIMSRMPPEILSHPLQIFFTFVVPVLVMTAFPAKALLGILTPASILVGTVIAVVFFAFAWVLWGRALRSYSSIST